MLLKRKHIALRYFEMSSKPLIKLVLRPIIQSIEVFSANTFYLVLKLNLNEGHSYVNVKGSFSEIKPIHAAVLLSRVFFFNITCDIINLQNITVATYAVLLFDKS